MEQKLLNIGFGNSVIADKIVGVVTPNSAPMKRLKDEAKKDKRLIDSTNGRKTRSIIITDSNHIFLSAIQAETISNRIELIARNENTPSYSEYKITEGQSNKGMKK
ncbi:MAG: DUF370 domain-containing protein [Deltaproteobacteria bacterium]|nr:DUF370 domain-containing protein [Deltaproteobacteria bacterium]